MTVSTGLEGKMMDGIEFGDLVELDGIVTGFAYQKTFYKIWLSPFNVATKNKNPERKKRSWIHNLRYHMNFRGRDFKEKTVTPFKEVMGKLEDLASIYEDGIDTPTDIREQAIKQGDLILALTHEKSKYKGSIITNYVLEHNEGKYFKFSNRFTLESDGKPRDINWRAKYEGEKIIKVKDKDIMGIKVVRPYDKTLEHLRELYPTTRTQERPVNVGM